MALDAVVQTIAHYRQLEEVGRRPELQYNGVSSEGNNVELFIRAQTLNTLYKINAIPPSLNLVIKPEINSLLDKSSETSLREFESSTEAILNAIINGKTIEGVDIAESIQNPQFRFKSTKDPVISASMSEAFAILMSRARSEAGKKGSAERNRKSDEFAANMYNVIQNMQVESGVTTLQATVDLLNERGVRTYSGQEGSKWHLKTLQDLQKRWAKLGLTDKKPNIE
ncbi:hypothetical protein [Spirosoma sordidisoli]|uniref:Recombinase domain-containing protein n=1 Tax=Spirosoma sordidisoli TaxID=2502893 RepID=A0A4V1RVJ3_9BACT|nr:hypothetical protein [Spirosoma sordidisoli]RYC66968.1 hypothetical protein EQG79_26705 [Spirosoma sordidisoli]